jgi:hypothetical protein
VGFVVDKVASGQVISEYFGFPCQNRSFHQLLHHRHHHHHHRDHHRVAPFKGAKGSKVSKLAQRNVDF